MEEFLESAFKHIIAAITTLIVVLVFLAGYGAGQTGRWWLAFLIVIIYPIVVGLFR